MGKPLKSLRATQIWRLRATRATHGLAGSNLLKTLRATLRATRATCGSDTPPYYVERGEPPLVGRSSSPYVGVGRAVAGEARQGGSRKVQRGAVPLTAVPLIRSFFLGRWEYPDECGKYPKAEMGSRGVCDRAALQKSESETGRPAPPVLACGADRSANWRSVSPLPKPLNFLTAAC